MTTIDFNDLPRGVLPSDQIHDAIHISTMGSPQVWIFYNHGTRSNVLSDAGGYGNPMPIWIDVDSATGFEMRLIGFSTPAHIEVHGSSGQLEDLLWFGGDVIARWEGEPWTRLEVYAGAGDRISIDDLSIWGSSAVVPEPSSMSLLLLGLLLISRWRRTT